MRCLLLVLWVISLPLSLGADELPSWMLELPADKSWTLPAQEGALPLEWPDRSLKIGGGGLKYGRDIDLLGAKRIKVTGPFNPEGVGALITVDY